MTEKKYTVRKSVRLTPEQAEKWDHEVVRQALSNGRTSSDGFKEAFAELYRFFKDVMNHVHVIVTSQQGKKEWNRLLQERDLVLISEKGRRT